MSTSSAFLVCEFVERVTHPNHTNSETEAEVISEHETRVSHGTKRVIRKITIHPYKDQAHMDCTPTTWLSPWSYEGADGGPDSPHLWRSGTTAQAHLGSTMFSSTRSAREFHISGP